MRLVVDASVAIKWLLAEAGSPEARALAQPGTDLIAPDLVLTEVANALWRAARLARISAADAIAACAVLAPAFHQLHATPPLTERALQISLLLDHPVYECIYLALAEREAAALVTADDRLIALAAGKGIANVVPLGATP